MCLVNTFLENKFGVNSNKLLLECPSTWQKEKYKYKRVSQIIYWGKGNY